MLRIILVGCNCTGACPRALRRVITEPAAKSASGTAVACGHRSAQVTGGAMGRNQVPKLHWKPKQEIATSACASPKGTGNSTLVINVYVAGVPRVTFLQRG